MRILIVRLTAIGDVVHAMPVACALRDHVPGVQIGWLVEGHAGELLRGHEAVDHLIVAPRGWSRSLRQVLDLRRRLRPMGFEVTLDLQGLTKSAAGAWLSGAKRRIGFAGSLRLDIARWGNNDLFLRSMGREASRWFNNELVAPRSRHIVDRYLELLGPLGIEKPAVRFGIPQPPEAGRSAGEILAGLSMTRPLAILNPGAGKSSKLWAPERFAAVARELGRRHGMDVLVIWHRGDEKEMGQRILSEAEGCAKLAPPTMLPELAALCRRARIFVGCDTGPLHIAAAVGTPCVCLCGTLPAWRNGPYGQRHIAIQKAQLRGMSWQRHRAGNEAMLAISIEAVRAACTKILSSDPG